MVSPRKQISVVGRFAVLPALKLTSPARRLIALLALNNCEISRQAAADRLWPDNLEEIGRANLRRSLWQAPRGWIDSSGDGLAIDADCDLRRARDAAARAIEGRPVCFDEIDLLSADVLPGWHDEWAIEAQEDYRTLRVHALEAACRTLLAHGNYPLAIRAGAAAVTAEPLRESASEALITAHLAQHNRLDAIRCYRALARHLAEDLGVEPMPRLTSLLEHAGLSPCAA